MHSDPKLDSTIGVMPPTIPLRTLATEAKVDPQSTVRLTLQIDGDQLDSDRLCRALDTALKEMKRMVNGYQS